MDFIVKLPEKQHFRQTDENKWIDKQSPLLIIRSDLGNPLNRVCKIVISPQHGKSINQRTHSKLILKVVEFAEIPTHRLIRGVEIGRYSYIPKGSIWFASFPCPYEVDDWFKFLIYSFTDL